MGYYIESIADRLLQSLNHPKIYGSENPFVWMEMISMQGKTNFFERRVAEYQKARVMTGTCAHSQDKLPDHVLVLDAEF